MTAGRHTISDVKWAGCDVIQKSKVYLYANETNSLMTTEGSEGWWCVRFFFPLSDSETGFFFFLVPHICSHSQFLSGSVILALLQREWSVWFIWNKTLCMRFYLHFSSFRPALHLTEHASPSVSGQRGEKMSVPARWVRAFTFLPSEVKSILFHGWDLSGSTAQGGACRHPEQSRRGGGGKKSVFLPCLIQRFPTAFTFSWGRLNFSYE